MTHTLRWGLLSTARINRSLVGPLHQSTRSELVAVASRTLEKAQAYAAEKGIPTAYGSYEALLADPTLDVIYNPLPNSLHTAWSIKAAEAGKHVLCEKPLVLSLAEWDRLEAAAKDDRVKGVFVRLGSASFSLAIAGPVPATTTGIFLPSGSKALDGGGAS